MSIQKHQPLVDVPSDITHHTRMRPPINPKARLSRIYTPQPLTTGELIQLDAGPAKHLMTVLRHQAGDRVLLFNGDGHVHEGIIQQSIRSKELVIALDKATAPLVEANIAVHLIQAIGRGERMDWTIQKATELGIMRITPVLTERVGVKLDPKRAQSRKERWQTIAIHAAEQSGRVQVPVIDLPMDLAECPLPDDGPTWYLDPKAAQGLGQCERPTNCTLVVGPEGGFADQEIASLQHKGAVGIRLGPRVLRTETAGPAAMAAILALWGDFQ